MSGIISEMVDLGIASHQARSYTVNTPVYEGPLDLLLQLIERAELDITRLALAQVTDQYLEYLTALKERAADEVSAFLVIASKLLQIKSEALLPRPPIHRDGEEDPGEALARQLLAYKRFKEIAGYLAVREAANVRTYLRVAPVQRLEGTLDMTGLTLGHLVEAAETIFSRGDDRSTLDTVVSAPKITIREKIRMIARSLRQYTGELTFRSLVIQKPTRLEIVVTFLAMLELIKRRLVSVQQEKLFGEIEIYPVDVWNEEDSFELEFGE